MAFQKKTWKDRITEFPTRRTLTKSDGSTELVTVARAEGTVSQEGDAFNAASMNDLEERISQANNDLNNSLTANNTRFVFDYQDGKYGFNTDPNRGADTFFPFSSGAKAELLWENIADTSKDFTPQTVNFKENNYTHYLIEFWGRNDLRDNIATTVIIESTYTIATGYFKTRGAGCFYEAGGSSATRNIIVTSNKSIQFDAGYIDRNKNNNYMIPAKIYGVNVL
jgi:SOS-response transcriptional repressor LexA